VGIKEEIGGIFDEAKKNLVFDIVASAIGGGLLER
jgi:hypothetical protein